MSEPSTNLPPSSLVICSRNRPELLLETVQSVLQGDELPTELIVVDQSDGRQAQLASMRQRGTCQIRYVWSDTVGLSRARNIGIQAASHDIVAFTDDDMRVPPTWYSALVRALLRAGPHAVVTGRVLPGEPETNGSFVPALVPSEKPRTYTGRIGTDVLAGCQFATYRSVYTAVGPFDERLGVGARFGAAEDNDFGFRLLETGYQIVYAPQAVIYHRAWRGAGDFLPTWWRYGRGKGGYYAKYASFRDPYLLGRGSRDVGLRLIRFPWRFVHQPRLALKDLAYAAGVLSAAVEWAWTERRTATEDKCGTLG